jgi:hypothetical protein
MRRIWEVLPKKWTDVIYLFDDGEYSAIWGTYQEDNTRHKYLGVRWNGGNNPDSLGYPSQGGNPLWYCEPDFLSRPILEALQNELVRITPITQRNEYQRNISIALSECE